MTDATTVLVELEHYISRYLSTQPSAVKPCCISEHGINTEELSAYLAELIAEGKRHKSADWASHMTPSPPSEALLGQLLAGLHNGNLLSPRLYPLLSEIERLVITWLCQLFKQQYGHFTHGSSYANLEALWHARQHNNQSRIVYASTAVHYSIVKACNILDLELRYIATNQHDELMTEALAKACKLMRPMAIIATIGTSAAGAIDPIADCIKLAKTYDAWCHIDAAWGGSNVILAEFDTLFSEAAAANSLCFDPHKGWQQPKPTSVLLYQQPLTPLFCDVNYLETTPANRLPGSYGGELFLPLWLTVMMSGTKGLQHQVQTRLEQAADFAEQLAAQTAWPIFKSATGIVCFKPDASTDLSNLVQQGTFSHAMIAGEGVYRAVFSSADTKSSSLMHAIQPYL